MAEHKLTQHELDKIRAEEERRGAAIEKAMAEIRHMEKTGQPWDVMDKPVIEVAKHDFRNDEYLPGIGVAAGMKPMEALKSARRWWDKLGRHLILTQMQPEHAGVPSGILRGLEFDQLTKDEAITVCEAWYKAVACPIHFAGGDPTTDLFVDQLDPLSKIPGHTVYNPDGPNNQGGKQ